MAMDISKYVRYEIKSTFCLKKYFSHQKLSRREGVWAPPLAVLQPLNLQTHRQCSWGQGSHVRSRSHSEQKCNSWTLQVFQEGPEHSAGAGHLRQSLPELPHQGTEQASLPNILFNGCRLSKWRRQALSSQRPVLNILNLSTLKLRTVSWISQAFVFQCLR